MIPLTTIAQGDASRVVEPRRVIARTDEEWRALWAIHAGPDAAVPDVDLANTVVAAAFAGEKPSAGHTVAISATNHNASGVRLAVEESAPGPGMVSAAVMTSPFHIVAVPRYAAVRWAEADRGRGVEAAARTSDGARANRQPPSASSPSSTGLDPRTAAALAYLAGPFSGALVLFAESTSPFVRFHAWQSIVGLGGLGLAVIVAYLLSFFAIFVSATAVMVFVGVATAIWGVLVIAWALCLWKALSGERWTLPLAGRYADRRVTQRGRADG
jgi:uncharacterized membrane protein